MPRFSVIIPTYGRPGFLAEAISSVIVQTIDDFEVIVVDDASPEPVELQTDDLRVHLVRREVNGGPAAARNTGIEFSGGDHLAFLDDDDWYEPGRLEMAQNYDTDVALCWSAPNGRVINGVPGGDLVASTVPHLGVATIRRDAILPLDESFRTVEDVEWWIRMSDRQFRTIPEVGYNLRKHDSVRLGYGMTERINGSYRLLQHHADFFAKWPRAAAYRWRWIGAAALQVGDRRAARAALARSLRMDPSLGTARLLARSLR
ncbi:MAG: glycosyltransferase [Actinomycetota bacterium]|nr:glycosyltransferase [Actinomycetota bacterium]